MALEPITRQEQIIAGKDLEPITRTEKFLKKYGGVSSWNDLTDKPFGETTVMGDTLTWDGNTEGREKITMLNGKDYYRVSDAVLLETDLLNGFSVGNADLGNVVDFPYSDGNVMEIGGVLMFGDETVLAIPADNCDLIVEGQVLMTFAKKGIYFRDYVTSLTIPGYTGFETKTVKTIDPKYLPEGLPSSTIEVRDILTDVEGVYMDGQIMIPAECPLVAGYDYTVVWNGETYVCTAEDVILDGFSGVAIGDINVLSGGEPTGKAPFVIMPIPQEVGGGGVIAVPLDGATSLTISISGAVETVTPVDEKYLPITTKQYVIRPDEGTLTPGNHHYVYDPNFDAFADILYNGGSVWVEVGGVRYAPVSWYYDTANAHLVMCLYVFKDSTTHGICTLEFCDGTWTPPEA